MAYEFHVTVDGTKQGMFKSEMTKERSKSQIAGLAFGYGVKSPRDAASGQASGKRVHQPVTFVKQWGESSPQFFQALCTNEILKSVLFEFVKVNHETGEEYVYHTFKLVNATVSEVQHYIGSDVPTLQSADFPELERISLTFQRIEMANADGKTSAVDDWFQGK